MSQLSRRNVIAAMVVVPLVQACSKETHITVYRDPDCGCCDKWTQHLRASFGAKIEVIDQPDRSALYQKNGMPLNLASCHTAVADGLAFEGHVPAADIARFLKDRPAGYKGLAVPGMPNGSPGMEGPEPPDHFSVIAFGNGFTTEYATY